MCPGNAVDAVHEIERVHEPGDPHGAEHGQQNEHVHRSRPAADEHDGDHEAAEQLHDQPPADRQPVQVLGEPEQAEGGHREREHHRDRAPDQPGRDEQPGDDRDPAAAGGRDRVRRPVTGNVDNGRPAQ